MVRVRNKSKHYYLEVRRSGERIRFPEPRSFRDLKVCMASETGPGLVDVEVSLSLSLQTFSVSAFGKISHLEIVNFPYFKHYHSTHLFEQDTK